MNDIELNKKYNKLRKETTFKGCIHKDDDCDSVTSHAHSLQKNGCLGYIADSNSNVLGIEFSKPSEYYKQLLTPISYGKASTFTGFCNKHDKQIFEPIENGHPYTNNSLQNFLYAYRAFSLAFYERNSRYSLDLAHFEQYKDTRSKEECDCIKAQLINYNQHLKYMDNLRELINSYYDNKRYDRIHSEVIDWDNEFGFVATSMFFIYKDVLGNIINWGNNNELKPFFFTIFPHRGHTYVIMSCLSKHKTSYSFIKRQIIESDIFSQKVIISNLIAMYIENFYISPDWWKCIDETTKEKFIAMNKKHIGDVKPPLKFYKNFNLFDKPFTKQ